MKSGHKMAAAMPAEGCSLVGDQGNVHSVEAGDLTIK